MITRNLKNFKSYNEERKIKLGAESKYVHVPEHLLQELQQQKRKLLDTFKKARKAGKRTTWKIKKAHNAVILIMRYLYTWSKNDVVSSVRKRYCALGLELGLELELRLELGLGLGFMLELVLVLGWGQELGLA